MNGHAGTGESLVLEQDQDLQAVREIRRIVIDICRQNGGGHGGSALGMAPMAVALWKHTMRYNPANPEVSLTAFAPSHTSCLTICSSGSTEIDLFYQTGMRPCSCTPCSMLLATHI